MLALLYISGDAMKKEDGFNFVIFVATNIGICIKYRQEGKTNIYAGADEQPSSYRDGIFFPNDGLKFPKKFPNWRTKYMYIWI